MAIPIIPIIVIAGVAMFAGAAGKKAAPKKVTRDIPNGAPGALVMGTEVFIPVGAPDPEQEPVFGAICGPASERQAGVWSAFGHQGECLVFWDNDTEAAMTYYIQQAFDQSGYTLEEVCAPAPGWEGDPFDPDPEVTATWIPNPFQIELLKQALAKAYPQIPSDELPPKEVHAPGVVGTVDYVEVVWVFAMSILLRDICGYVPVT